ncbi:Protein of unknown function (DUF3046) [Propionicimonas paludicola]|uniref:DUF3046 family protein n=1 Tax=Propionicimonas paludicola TaxID=185243 RepID=A0A2A9CQ85_9ACTN|nr:DUF3046 domain-containing protein [Propionicimonas paludicola]PFG16563.1 Protein of unknown function (DUF3046) [Propionicimonas paludicola]
MREGELRGKLAHHLGATYSLAWADTVVIGQLEHRTVSQALAAGLPCRRIWLAAWAALELPDSER